MNYILGGTIVLLGIALTLLTRAYIRVSPTLVEYGKGLVAAIKTKVEIEVDRDEWKAKAIKLEIEKRAAEEQLERTAAHVKQLLEENAREKVDQIRNAATAADALDAFNRVLQDVPGLPTSVDAKTTSADHNSSSTPSV